MKIVNRGFIAVTPKSSFIEKIRTIKEGDILVSDHPEPTVYLIEEEFWDDELIVKKYLKKILQAELRQILQASDPQITDINSQNFYDYFEIQTGGLVFDLEDQGIERFTDDGSD